MGFYKTLRRKGVAWGGSSAWSLGIVLLVLDFFIARIFCCLYFLPVLVSTPFPLCLAHPGDAVVFFSCVPFIKAGGAEEGHCENKKSERNEIPLLWVMFFCTLLFVLSLSESYFFFLP